MFLNKIKRMHLKPNYAEVLVFCYSAILFVSIIGVATGNAVHKRKASRSLKRNRDGDLPNDPKVKNATILSSYIVEAHELIREGLQEFLDFKDADLGKYLNHLINQRSEPFVDEYGQVIRLYKKVFRFIWEQHNETLEKNYGTGHFGQDKLNLCSVARYLSHQPTVEQRVTIMQRMGDALRYRCHPCTPYTPKQYDETIIPSIHGINPEGVSPKESLLLCKENQTNVKSILPSFDTLPLPRNISTMQGNNPTNPLSYDYSPCTFSNLEVVCDQVLLEEVKKVFYMASDLRFLSIQLILQPFVFTETYIPEDVLGNKRVLEIMLQYPPGANKNSSLTLQVDPNAFRSTKNYTRKVTLNNFDCNLLDLIFLSGFEKLTDIHFANLWNIEFCFPSLPPLPRFAKLSVEFCVGMNELYSFPILQNGLKVAVFLGFDDTSLRMYNDATVDRILEWLLLSSANTLKEINIERMNQITQVPRQIPSFKALRKLGLESNNISAIRTGAFMFSLPVITLHIEGNGIKEIEPGAFQGNFKDAVVFVNNNYFTQVEEAVFVPMLQQMASGTGSVDFEGNQIDCGSEKICRLGWLNRYEAGVKSLICSNGTRFKNLHSTGFNHCPQINSN